MSNATLTRIGIVNAHGTDGYSLVYEYSDGSQSSPQGWYGDKDTARAAALPPGGEDSEYAHLYVQAPVEDWTDEDEDE